MSNRTIKTCSIEGCGRAGRIVRGWCEKHYKRWQVHGDPHKITRIRAKTPEESFKARTKWQGDCLQWTGPTVRGGYAHIYSQGKAVYVHRFAWEKVYGHIPDGMDIDHICHNRICVNVEHLRLATKSQNNAYKSPGSSGAASGVRNVYRVRNKWMVKIGKNGIHHYFGVYSNIEEAKKVAEQARIDLFGEFAGNG